MATATDAARERVLIARAALGDELTVLEASARAAVDIPAKVKANPVKAATVAGGAAFFAVRGPRRVARGIRRVIKGPSAPMPKRMLPDEIEAVLSKYGSDGDAVRGALERDFADYARRAAKNRSNIRNLLAISLVRPFVLGGSRAASRWLFSSGDDASFGARLAQVRERLEHATGQQTATNGQTSPTTSKTGSPRDDAEDVSGA